MKGWECHKPYLVEFKQIEEVEELSVLLALLELDIVLLEAVQGQLSLIIYKHFKSLNGCDV